MFKNSNQKTGECEVCTRVDVSLTLHHGNMWFCEECWSKELDLQAKNTTVQAQATRIRTVEESRKIDSASILQSDIYNAKTVAAVELRAAILADESIPESEKEHAFTKECETRVIHLQDVIFRKRQELNADEHELKMWQTEGQNSAGKLREEIRAGFTKFNVNYVPKSPKTPKPVVVKKTKVKVSLNDAKDAAAKHGLDTFSVKFTAEARNMTAEQAAKFLVEMKSKKVTK